MVIFEFLAEIEAIKGVLEKQGVGYEWLGAVPMEERGDKVRKFQNDPECCVSGADTNGWARGNHPRTPSSTV